jgi:ribosomal protein S21
MAKKTKKTATTNSSSVPPEMDFSYFSPPEIKVKGNFERAFKAFRSLIQAEKILTLYKEKQSYEKPSEKRRRKYNESVQRNLELEARQKKIKSGEFEKEKAKKLAKKEKKRLERQQKQN